MRKVIIYCSEDRKDEIMERRKAAFENSDEEVVFEYGGEPEIVERNGILYRKTMVQISKKATSIAYEQMVSLFYRHISGVDIAKAPTGVRALQWLFFFVSA